MSAGKAGLVGGEQLVGYFERAPLDVAYCLASPDWRCVLRQPVASQIYLLQLTPARLTALALLIMVSATVTVYRGYRRTLFFLLGIISLFIC